MTRDEILPDFMRREIEREIYAAEHPVGMSTHDGKAKIQATTLRRLMRLVAENERLRAEQLPTPPEECQTEAEKKAFAFGYWSGVAAIRARGEKP